MNCEHYTEAIDDLIDGVIDPVRREELQRHLAECTSCKSLVADLVAIRDATSRLPAHKPPARVWERLSKRLPATPDLSPDVAPASAPTHDRRRWFESLRSTSGWRFAWAAGVTLAVAALVLVVALPRLRPTPPSTAVATQVTDASRATVHANGPELVQSVESELVAAEQHYQKAIGGLEQMAKAGEGTLDPKVASAIKQNLSVVDQAIAESRNALQTQPTNELAQESLFEAFRRKVGLLQDTVALVNEMRKGNQAETAKILGNMKK